MRILQARPVPRLLLALLALGLVAWSGVARAAGGGDLVEACRKDLARRLSIPVQQIRVASTRQVVFPDSSLGLPEPGQCYAMAQVPGTVLVLQAGQGSYLYTGAGSTFRYGGPRHGWRCSALFLEAVPDEPNLNGNLFQTSLAGTNPRLVLEGVSDFHPQVDGSLLAIRRTSRSGHDLLYLAPGQAGAARLIQSALAFVSPVLAPDGKRWAALVRPGVGQGWRLVRSSLEAAPDQAVAVELPEGARPTRVDWEEPNPIVEAQVSGQTRYYEQVGTEGAAAWKERLGYAGPQAASMMLNKSETLDEGPSHEGGTRVARVWFTGEEKVIARIPNFDVTEFSLSQALDFVVLSGRSGQEKRAFAVDVNTGEVLALPAASLGETRLWMSAPAGWDRLQQWTRP